MSNALTKSIAGTLLLFFIAAGNAGDSSKKHALLEDKKASASDAEVAVTIAVPEGTSLTGTAIVTLEDIALQDVPSVTLAEVSVATSTFKLAQPTVIVPIDLQLITARTEVNVAVHIDADDDGLLSDGDWISDTLVPAVNNNIKAVVVDVIKIGS